MINKDPQAPGRHVDASQELVITSRARGIRVVAPAGSGKTETLVRRAAKRISDDGVRAKGILILSFDKSAEKSFEQKFKRLAPRVTMPEVCTLNSLGNTLLRQYFSEERGTLVNNDQRSQLNRVLTREFPQPDVLHWDGRHRTLSDTFKALKNQGILPEDSESTRARKWLRSHFLQLPDQGESLSVGDIWSLDDSPTQMEQYDTQIAEIFTSYLAFDRYMRDQGWMDYDDQKLRPLKGLRENHEIREKVRGLYDEVIVDECQDINRLEALLIWSIVGENTTLTIAGDDDQSLYEFKEANSLYLREPDRHFGRPFETCHLNTNYRTPQELLSPALKLIDHNFERLEKTPHSGVAHAGKVELHPARTVLEHDRELASRVASLIGTKGATGTTIRPEDVAILCPNGPVLDRMRNALRRFSVNTAVITTTDGRQPEGLVFVDTMRKAKGRQWRVVVLPESTDALMPGDKSARTGDMESQRRQYYVAMTRASETLIVGYIRQGDNDEVYRNSSGEVLATNGASRFLFEAGMIGATQPDAQLNGSSTEVLPPPVESEPDTPVQQRASSPTKPPVSIPDGGLAKTVDKVADPVPTHGSPSPSALTVTPIPAKQPPTDTVPLAKPKNLGAVSVIPKSWTKPTKEKHTRAAQPWDLLQEERDALEKARRRLDEDDLHYAFIETWTVFARFLRRVVNPQEGTDVFDWMKLLEKQKLASDTWIDTMHRWRKLRNVKKFDFMFNPMEKAIAEECVRKLPEVVAHIGQQMRPRQSSFLDTDPKIKGISGLVTIVQTGSPHPLTKKPVRALRFRPVEDAKDMLIMQLLMVLRDVRYYTPVDYRWSTSPIFARVSNDLLGYCHTSIRGSGRNQFNIFSPAETTEIVDLLRTIVISELETQNCSSTLARVFDDARAAGNGDYPVGLKLNPKRE